MRRKPIELAAVATAAVPGLTPTAVSSAPDDPADFDSALLLDSEGKRWRVRSPRHAEASARLETEYLVLRAFSPAIRAELPFLMPTVAGSVRLGTLSTFVYSHLAGSTRSVEELTAGPAALAREIGVALAAIHDLPRELVSNADLPSYTPNEFRQRRLNELDQAATTGKIPPALLLRWEHALEDVSLWRFNPCVVHGDLHEDNLLVEGHRVTAVTGWTDLRIGDPADDFAWLVASNEQDFVDAVVDAYTSGRRDTPDKHLLRRAALSAEFALAQYLVKGIAAGDASMVAEAEEMLTTLAGDIEEHGGQPISVEPLPTTAAAAAAVTPVHAAPAVPASAAPDSVPGMRAADEAMPASVPAVTVLHVPAQPAVHVTPIPVTPSPAAPGAGQVAPVRNAGEGSDGNDGNDGNDEKGGAAGSNAGGTNSGTKTDVAASPGGSDDTSTAVLTIVDSKKT
ncbi:macrolide 2'-phosphotransferase [Pseudarthrobacter sp. NamE5]|uniref:macrolide 2'-phosphotransferase n=1 Tax=Pseudarthrobacter sp. NamE5 TaxID=2576839 RepID=UPI00110A4186|nr:macrolide 2'-phosphotransferase [Pseudarthrobacter sp. NamE5]TLM86835.1 aminoglycoside phosphotransferase [Pseudarthrobacter sp. NamE5]